MCAGEAGGEGGGCFIKFRGELDGAVEYVVRELFASLFQEGELVRGVVVSILRLFGVGGCESVGSSWDLGLTCVFFVFLVPLGEDLVGLGRATLVEYT